MQDCVAPVAKLRPLQRILWWRDLYAGVAVLGRGAWLIGWRSLEFTDTYRLAPSGRSCCIARGVTFCRLEMAGECRFTSSRHSRDVLRRLACPARSVTHLVNRNGRSRSTHQSATGTTGLRPSTGLERMDLRGGFQLALGCQDPPAALQARNCLPAPRPMC
jgi:hypothetical protein